MIEYCSSVEKNKFTKNSGDEETKGNSKANNKIEDMIFILNRNIDAKIEVIREFFNKLNSNSKKKDK